MSSNTLTVTDNRTNRTYTLPIEDETVCATDFRKMRAGEDDFGLMVYDPGFVNTASCKSSITFIDGEHGILEFRGYPIELLAEHCTFLEVAYLLLFGELPDEAELKQWAYEITHHTHAARNHHKVHGGLPLRRPPHVHGGEHCGHAVRGLS